MARAAFVVLVLLALRAHTAPLDASARWREQLARSGEALKANQFGKAQRIVDEVLADMEKRLGPGKAATEVLGIAITHKALALAGQGNHEEALWWWHIVVSMDPAFTKSDLSGFGVAGAFLTANRELPSIDHLPHFDETFADVPGITAPRPRAFRAPLPQFPRGALWFRVEETLRIDAVIRRDGRLASPRVIQGATAPTLIYATADSMRKWRFHPAKQNGETVDSVLTLVANYRIAR
jgi:hypothetical protein